MVERFRARDGVVPVLKESGGATAPSYQQVKDGVSESALVLEVCLSGILTGFLFICINMVW